MQENRRRKNKNFFVAFKIAMQGVIYAVKNERNIQIQLIIGILAVVASVFFKITKMEAIAVTISIAMVLLGEMCNTAIERAVDLCTEEIHPLAKAAKDVAAGAVLVPVLSAIVVAYFVFFDRIIGLFIK